MKLTVQTFLTLDGVMQAPGGPEEDPSDAFTHGGWQAPFPDPAVGEFVTELNSHASAFLFGRRTFDIFRGYWPDQTDPANPIATAINSLPKYVVSNSLSEADATWRGEHPDTARLVTGDVVAAVQALKDEPGDELQIWGSGNLLQTLLQHELVDRFRLMTFPLVLGSGRRLFDDGIVPATMRPVDLTVTDLGIVSAPTNQPVRFATARCDRLRHDRVRRSVVEEHCGIVVVDEAEAATEAVGWVIGAEAEEPLHALGHRACRVERHGQLMVLLGAEPRHSRTRRGGRPATRRRSCWPRRRGRPCRCRAARSRRA